MVYLTADSAVDL